MQLHCRLGFCCEMDRLRIIRENVRTSSEYLRLVDHFIEVATDHASVESRAGIRCPCKDCKNDVYLSVRMVRSHLIMRGFDRSYRTWVWHGEVENESKDVVDESWVGRIEEEEVCYDEKLNDLAEDVARHFVGKPKVLEAMFNDKKTPLYDGSSHTVLSATLLMVNLKAKHGLSDKAMSEALLLVKELLPAGNLLPDRSYAAKKILCPMGMEMEKIHACPNDCMLYRGDEDEKRDSCRVCNAPRFTTKDENIEVGAEDVKNVKKKTPAKVMWYLPIIPRLQRLFANKVDAQNLTWHADRMKPDDDVIRHTSDGDQWKKIDELFPTFGNEPRNVRLGLSTDGMNPYGDLSSTHSSWPVMVVIYNLPSWLTMKRKYVLLSLMISGPRQPGNDIDVYLAPLIEDLMTLWYHENWTYDGYRDEWFKLRGMLLFTINDFPAYGNLAGYSVKGHLACPICEKSTSFCQLKHWKKTVYQGHRRFLPKDDPLRKAKKWFDGKVDEREAPTPLTGTEILGQLIDFDNDFGKNRKKTVISGPWKKCSIFFELPYWEHLDVRHCLDVMHIEKNVCDSVLGTMLNLSGKTKDSLKSRKDLAEMGLRPDLAVVEEGGKAFLPPACYTMSGEEKRRFCESLKGVKVPSTYSSNIGSCVNLDEAKIGGLKSHDCHVLMQELILIALRGCLPNHVRTCISQLCLFFKAICRKNISRSRLDKLQEMVVQVLCRMEMFFPPSFFDIMVHLIVHLVREVKLCGPVFLRWMYPFERYMKIFKAFVKNRYRPDASIVQRYVAEESIEFATAYLGDIETVGIPTKRHQGRMDGHGLRHGKFFNPSADDLSTAHFYVLRNLDVVQPYIELHMNELRRHHRSWKEPRILEEHLKNFSSWLRDTVDDGEHVESVKWLSRRPLGTVIAYTGYDIHGYTFGTKAMDARGVSQNSGVSLVSNELFVPSGDGVGAAYMDRRFFGTITDIWELNYVAERVVVFKCDWVDPGAKGTRTDPLGFTLVDRRRRCYTTDSFILASQADQVFYVQDPADTNLEVVVRGKKTFVGMESPYECMNEDDDFPIGTNLYGHSLAETEANLKKIQARTDHAEGIWVDAHGNVRKRKFKVKKLKKVKQGRK